MRLYDEKFPTSQAKYTDLKQLCTSGVIPTNFHDQYLSLIYEPALRDCLADSDVEDQDPEDVDEHDIVPTTAEVGHEAEGIAAKRRRTGGRQEGGKYGKDEGLKEGGKRGRKKGGPEGNKKGGKNGTAKRMNKGEKKGKKKGSKEVLKEYK